MLYSTPELLRAVGLKPPVFYQWITRNHISLTTGTPGTGNHRQHDFSDVAQVAIVAELSRVGVPLSRAAKIWLVHIRPSLMFPRSDAGNAALLIAPNESGSDHLVRPVSDPADMGLDRPDAPNAFIVFCWGKMVRRLREALAAGGAS